MGRPSASTRRPCKSGSKSLQLSPSRSASRPFRSEVRPLSAAAHHRLQTQHLRPLFGVVQMPVATKEQRATRSNQAQLSDLRGCFRFDKLDVVECHAETEGVPAFIGGDLWVLDSARDSF